MFGWLKRRLLREHRKLLWQNQAVATDHELKTRLLFAGRHDLADGFDSLSGVALDMFAKGVPPSGLTDNFFKIGLQINRDFRYLFEVAYNARPSQFDPKYVPLGGWAGYYDRTEDSV